MSIWFKPYTLKDVITLFDNNLSRHLGIEFREIGPDYLTAAMPVDERTKMAFGGLHGGASCVLAEELGTYASYLCIDPDKNSVVGLEINANHVRGVAGGHVYGLCTPIHRGRSTHIWDIRISDEKERVVCVSRMTVAVLNKE